MKDKLDPYETLGVNKNASKAEIKKAHRRKVNQTHPDKGGSQEAFLAVQKSYRILNDDQKRKQFDETGKTDEHSIHERCMGELANLAVAVVSDVNNIDHVDIVKIMREHIETVISMHEEHKTKNEGKAAKFKAAAKRFKAKKETENVFAKMLEGQASLLSDAIRNAENEIMIAKTCLEILSGFEYEFTADVFDNMWAAHGFKVKTLKSRLT